MRKNMKEPVVFMETLLKIQVQLMRILTMLMLLMLKMIGPKKRLLRRRNILVGSF